MEVSCLALPPAAEVVVPDLAGGHVADHGVDPIGQSDSHASGLTGVQREGALFGLVEIQAATRGLDRREIADFCTYRDNV